MTRDELVALRTALYQTLSWSDHVREAIVQWLTPQASKPNGLGNGAGQERLKTPRRDAGNRAGDQENASQSRAGGAGNPVPGRAGPYAGKTHRRGLPPISAKAHEQRLLAAMQEHSGASVNVLAKAAGANRSSTGERLRGLASRGVVTKDSAGHWRLVAELAGEEPGPTQPGEEARPTLAPSS